MNSCELGATVRRESNRLVVRINEDDQAKADGVASLICVFVDDSDASKLTTESRVDESTGTGRSVGSNQLKQPEDKLKRTKAKLKAAEERKDELETKSLRYGPRSLDSGELAELEKLKDETIPQLEKEIEDWDAENRQEETRLSGDSRPFLK